MKLYAETSGRRAAQAGGDLFLLLWCALWVWLGVRLHDLVLLLGKPGAAMEDVGDRLSGSMSEASDRLADLPFVGRGVRAPFDDAADAADRLARAGVEQQAYVGDLALFLGIAFALLPILLLLVIWVPRRVRFVRRATAAQRLLDSAFDLDLFALRALATQPMHVLARISDDPAGAWRRQEPATTRALAQLELKDSGLRLPGA